MTSSSALEEPDNVAFDSPAQGIKAITTAIRALCRRPANQVTQLQIEALTIEPASEV